MLGPLRKEACKRKESSFAIQAIQSAMSFYFLFEHPQPLKLPVLQECGKCLSRLLCITVHKALVCSGGEHGLQGLKGSARR